MVKFGSDEATLMKKQKSAGIKESGVNVPRTLQVSVCCPEMSEAEV